MEKFKLYIFKHADIFSLLGLCILFYFIFFHNIWAYALMDVDESRYVSMARDMFHSGDFLTLHLNNDYFFEKPPLFFWGECLSFTIFGKINELTARFPVALYGTLCCFIIYFLGKKIVSIKYGIISSLILATSLEFLILAKFAILDILVAFCIALSLCFGILTNFCQEHHKKYMWWLFYIFSALAVLAKGIPGFVIPFGSMFFISLYSKNVKDIFKPQYFIVGTIIFLLITLPWHIIMFKMHNPEFFNEYILKHHLARFLGSEEIKRIQPFYFYFITLLWGFFPWIFSALAVLIRKIQIRDFRFRELNNSHKLIAYSGIIVIFTLLFFSSSETKLITYILPLYPALAVLGGYIWTNYIERGEYKDYINKTVYITGILYIFIATLACFTQLYLPDWLNNDINEAKPICIISFFLCGFLSIAFCKKEKYLCVFLTYVIFMTGLSAFATDKFFKIDYKFGQNDLMEFAAIAKKLDKTIACYKFTHKYSLRYYADEENEPIEFGIHYNIDDLKKELSKERNLVIIQKKHIDKEVRKLKYKVLKEGQRYVLIEGLK